MKAYRFLAMPATAAIVALLAAGCAGKPATSVQKSPSGSPTVAPATPTATASSPTATVAPAVPTPVSPTAAGPAGGPIPAGFAPMSVTFVSLQTGWVLGASCPTCTVSLLRTRDGGKTWASVAAPPTPAPQGPPAMVRFANVDDGWVLASELWATHDGGGRWAKPVLPGAAGGQVSDVEAAAGFVHAAVLKTADTGGVVIETSPVHQDVWRASATTLPLGAGPIPGARITLQGTAGWIIENDRVVVAGARLVDGQWMPWQPPCPQAGGPAMLAASSPHDVVAVCNEGLYGGPPVGVRAYVSTDGLTFRQARTTVPLRDLEGLASPSAGVMVVAGAEPAPGVVPRLVASRDGGSTWAAVYDGRPDHSIQELGFTSATQGVAIESGSNLVGATLLMTQDGSRTWKPVPFTQASQ